MAKRVDEFRGSCPDYALTTEVILRDEQYVVMKATIANPDGFVLATGYAEENRNGSQINKTSALENAETSAIGRALAAFGFGGTEFASANEVQNAIQQQNELAPTLTDEMRDEITVMAQGAGVTVQGICKRAGVDSLKEIPAADFEKIKEALQRKMNQNAEKGNS